MTTAPLSDLVVLETSGDIATRYCGKLFAAHGARVIQAYLPDNRGIGYGSVATDAYAAWLDAGKETGAAPPDTRVNLIIAGQTSAEVAAAETLAAGMSPRPLLLALTWFGPHGPYAGWSATDGVIQAMTGVAYAIGEKDGPPILPQGHAPQIVAGATGLIAALSALIGRRAGHPVDRVETNVLEAHLCFAEHAGPGFFKGGPASQRRGVNRYMPVYPQTIFPSADGWIGVTALTPLQWQELCRMIGLPEVAEDPRFATTDQRLAACEILDEILAPALKQYTTTYLLEEGQRRRIPLAPVPDMQGLLDTPHWRERGSFARFDGFEGPAMPFRLHPRGPGAGTAWNGPDPLGKGPLAGLRVLDLSMGWSGPLTGRHYADLGAEVVKVEGCAHIDWWRGWNALEAGDPPPYELRANFNAVNRNKRGIALDLTKPDGADLLRRLAAGCDVLIENYAPGVLTRLGFGPEAMAAVNPRLVYISMGAFGSVGPWSGFRASGSTTEQAAGMPFLQGEAHWPPTMQHTAYGDPVAGIYAAVATLIALYGRERTGGTTIDLSQVECLFQLAADGIIAQSATGEPPPRTGSRRADRAWRGCLRCAGSDAWVAVDLDDWNRLAAMGLRVDGLVSWAAARSPQDAAAALQRAGIIAGPVTPAHRLLEDSHLGVVGFWRQAERRYAGTHLVPKPPYALDGTSPPLRRPSPTLGEHNEEVLRSLLGLSAPQVADLVQDGIIGNRAI
ncbi:MAG: CoA transferase [Proteobacteria bacterium]|nr:CoA transferase [Pseudomonadota bacterium]